MVSTLKHHLNLEQFQSGWEDPWEKYFTHTPSIAVEGHIWELVATVQRI